MYLNLIYHLLSNADSTSASYARIGNDIGEASRFPVIANDALVRDFLSERYARQEGRRREGQRQAVPRSRRNDKAGTPDSSLSSGDGHKGVTSQGARALTSPGRRDSPEESAALPAGSRPARDYVSERRFPPAVTCFTDVAQGRGGDGGGRRRRRGCNDKGKFRTVRVWPSPVLSYTSFFLAAPR